MEQWLAFSAWLTVILFLNMAVGGALSAVAKGVFDFFLFLLAVLAGIVVVILMFLLGMLQDGAE